MLTPQSFFEKYKPNDPLKRAQKNKQRSPIYSGYATFPYAQGLTEKLPRILTGKCKKASVKLASTKYSSTAFL